MMDIIMVGSGGCMRELAWQILEDNRNVCKWNIVGYIDDTYPIKEKEVTVGSYRIPYIGNDQYLLNLQTHVNIVLSVGSSKLRKRIANTYMANKNIHFPNIILGSAYVCNDLICGQGCIIAMDARISTNVKMGDFVFVNTGSMICHDGCIGNFVTLGPRVQIAGAVMIDDNTEIGMNASIIQCLTIGKNVAVGAGAVVIKDVNDNVVMVGVPARKVEK